MGDHGNTARSHNAVFKPCRVVVKVVGGRWFSLSCAKNAEASVLLDLSSARRRQRDESITAEGLSALRGFLGQLMWLATQVNPQLQAPLSLLVGYVVVSKTIDQVLKHWN